MVHSPFRDEFIAASLKQIDANLLANLLDPFRDEFIAASLKRGQVLLHLRCAVAFRDEFIAASLKLRIAFWSSPSPALFPR